MIGESFCLPQQQQQQLADTEGILSARKKYYIFSVRIPIVKAIANIFYLLIKSGKANSFFLYF